jgi:hypothetical protein
VPYNGAGVCVALVGVAMKYPPEGGGDPANFSCGELGIKPGFTEFRPAYSSAIGVWRASADSSPGEW